MMTRNWGSAYGAFMDKPFVQTMLLHPGIEAEILINQDPEIIRALDEAAKRAEAERAAEQRMEDMRRERFRTETGVIMDEEEGL